MIREAFWKVRERNLIRLEGETDDCHEYTVGGEGEVWPEQRHTQE